MGNFPNVVGPNDVIQIVVGAVGTQGGARTTIQINESYPASTLLAKAGVGAAKPTLDTSLLTKLAEGGDTSGAMAMLANFSQAASQSKAATAQEQVVAAVSYFLVNTKGLIQATSDPGVNKLYFNPNDLAVSVHAIDGINYWVCSLTAPYGA